MLAGCVPVPTAPSSRQRKVPPRRGDGKPLEAVEAEDANDTQSSALSSSLEVRFHPVVICPLANLGNTCYFNSGMQLLASCDPFVFGLRDSPFRHPTQRNTAIEEASGINLTSSLDDIELTSLLCRGGTYSRKLLKVVSELLYTMETTELQADSALEPHRALHHLGEAYPAFEGRNQQDVAEFLNVVVANLAEEGRIEVNVAELLESFKTAASKYAQCSYVSQSSARQRDLRKRTPDGDADIHSRSPRQSNETPSTSQSRTRDFMSNSGEGSSLSASAFDVQTASLASDNRKPQLANGGSARDGVPHADADTNGSQRTEDNIFSPPSGSSNAHTTSAASQTVEDFFPGSAHVMRTFRLMDRVNHENEVLERKEKERKKEPYRDSFHPPKVFYNNATDAFKGYVMSEIECHRCKTTSRVVEEFNSLMVDIPSNRQRYLFARDHPEIVRNVQNTPPTHKKSSTTSWRWWNPLNSIGALVRWFGNAMSHLRGSVQFALTLEECLDIHFAPVSLRDGNRYHCASCGTVSDATKQERLLMSPEYLLVQMKRFDYSVCFHNKKDDPVIFPMSWNPRTRPDESATGARNPIDGSGCTHNRQLPGDAREVLDLSAYVSPLVHSSAKPSCLKENASQGHQNDARTADASTGATTSSAESAGQKVSTGPGAMDPVFTYTLEAIVNHHGSIGGGHYTACSRKKSGDKDVWVQFNDELVDSIVAGDVADSEEYMLLYRKQALYTMPPWHTRLQRLAREYLSTTQRSKIALEAACVAAAAAVGKEVASSDRSSNLDRKRLNGDHPIGAGELERESDHRAHGKEDVVFVSRLWLQRMSLYVEPGPIINDLCYCTSGQLSGPVKDTGLWSRKANPRSQQHGSAALPPHVHGPSVEWFYIPVSRKDFASFFDVYGGNEPVSVDEYLALLRKQDKYVSMLAAETAQQRTAQ